ncbi:MAG: glycoside hydrolase family 57 protein [Bacteroidetes bacterium]|nr:glycoside hydrolase family 57 protein [Bacteroidota bacterium]
MTLPLRILFVWHHHQPYYKKDGTFLMPWVRMHGIKDYWDMVRILDDYPGIKQTFNFAPSLLEQIDDYLAGNATDAAYNLSAKDPALFSDSDRIKALKTFFLAEPDRMIGRYRRYAELFAKRGNIRDDKEIYAVKERFSIQDYRDLQVWWNLAWVGEYSRFDPPFKRYLDKEREFTEDEKHRLLSAQLDIMARIIPHHIEAAGRKQIEVAVSPFYHPILPLLCDSRAGAAANPHAKLPVSTFKHPEDAEEQIGSALRYAGKVFGFRPAGMWPSEGSVSDAAMKLFSRHKVAWVATDEAILHKSLVKSGRSPSANFLEKYFGYTYSGGSKPVVMFFRDHALSDKIGFVYSHWSPDDAARDFTASLLRIRESIIGTYGEKALDYAVVPVILDGENAWEFYQSDGKDFLRTLYHLLENEPRLRTVLPSETRVRKENSLRHIEPGSWINGNFDIWIGQPEDNKAWDLLYGARKSYARHSAGLSGKQQAHALKEIMICEGSDWCWWYGDEHKSAQAAEFDNLFRYHLKQVYVAMGIESPPSLDEPIKRKVEHLSYRQAAGIISPRIGKFFDQHGWQKAGYVEQEQATGAMQKTGQLIKRVLFGNDKEALYLVIETAKPLSSENVHVDFYSPVRISLGIGNDASLRCERAGEEVRLSLHCSRGDVLQIRIGITEIHSDEATFTVSMFDGDTQLDSLPHQGLAKFKLHQ